MAGGMCGGGHVWLERWPLQQVVRILLECILVTYFVVFESKINIPKVILRGLKFTKKIIRMSRMEIRNYVMK